MMLLLGLASVTSLALATPNPFAKSALDAEPSTANGTSSLRVDLGYSIYEGYHDVTSGLNVFKGIRFADAPLGRLRWQRPQPPATNRNKTLDAREYSPKCPQNGYGLGPLNRPYNETGTSEDCLFLIVWAPAQAGAKKLPVMLWIHGGGYGFGNGQYDFSDMINTNNNSFIGVAIQYRLGAFGFLSSDEVHRKGVPNAGLLDQQLALEWVQQYIHLFNGDKDQVTLAGESAGAGSVMLHAMAYSGTHGTALFKNAFGASPYLPPQYGYKDWIPSQSYYAFATAAGCDAKDPYLHNGSLPIFECLQAKESKTLINASRSVSSAGLYGAWAFAPVTDGTLVQERPSVQLAEGKVNGLNGLFGNNANEGYLFVPQVIHTENALVEWLKVTFPLFSAADIKAVLEMYPSTNAPDNLTAPLFATNGIKGPTAVNQSSLGTGHQQRANLIYGEATFVCPSHWLAQAYTHKNNHTSCNSSTGSGYKYQFSIPPSIHASDVQAYFPTVPSLSGMAVGSFTEDFSKAFQTFIGNFVTKANPGTVEDMGEWPVYDKANGALQVDLNTTCSVYVPGDIKKMQLPYCEGGENAFSVVNSESWEGGRQRRCEFWRGQGARVPE